MIYIEQLELIHKSGDVVVSSKNNQKIIRKNCLPPCSIRLK